MGMDNSSSQFSLVNQPVMYTTSYKKILLLFLASVMILGIVSSFSLKKTPSPSIEGFLFGSSIGAVFGSFVIFYGAGQRLYIDDNQIEYSANLFALLISSLRKRLSLSEVKEVTLGLPKVSQIATFAAINIRTENQEITFQSDLFDESTLQKLFLQLQKANPNIVLDPYALKIIGGENSEAIFRNKALSNLGLTTILLTVDALLLVAFYKIGLLSKEATMVFGGISFFALPFIFNFIMNKSILRNKQ